MPGEVAEEKTEDPPPAKPVVGIIYPPPDVRNIVDKTADFVARNGPEFAERIKQNEAGNPKFNFLNPSDPYHAYYVHKIGEIKEGVAVQESTQQKGAVKGQPEQTITAEVVVPKEPPPEWEFLLDPPSISAIEINIVKLTAMFVAKNGASFLEKLMIREQKNYQFDFLRKQHTLFNYFSKLVEQYSKILLPTKEMKAKLVKDFEDPLSVLDRVRQRSEWERHQAHVKKKEQEELEKEKMEYAAIGWHDFVVVETINFREDEAGFLPAPIQPSQLAARLIEQAKYDKIQEETEEVEEIEMELEDEESSKPEPPPLPPSQPQQPSMVVTGDGSTLIRKDYNPRAAKTKQAPAQKDQQMLVSPITGELIPADKMEEHMRFSLLDPRWREQQQKSVEEKKIQDEIFAEGMQIDSSLKYLAERRTDIFGQEETIIGKKIGEEGKKQDKVQWDGFRASADALSSRVVASITSEEEMAFKRKQEEQEKSHIGPTGVPTKPKPPDPVPAPQPKPMAINPAPPIPRPINPPSLFQQSPMQQQQQQQQLQQQLQQQQQQQQVVRALLPSPLQGQQNPGTARPMQPPPAQPLRPMLPQFQNMRPPFMPPMGLMGMHPPPAGEEPGAKKARTDADNLIPEAMFIQGHPGPVTFKIQMPKMPDKPELNLNGQIVMVTLPITDHVSVLKAKVTDEVNMPASKQKLQIGSIFLKDSNSLGYYNITADTVVTLSMKERGGRKK